MAHRRAMLAIVVGAILLSYAIPASGDSLTVYRLEPSSGWVELPPVNPYATAVRENPLQGWSNAGATSWPLKATAKFEPDTKKAELTVEFIPISRDIRANAGNLFIAPLGRRLEWRLVVTVRNPNDVPMKQVKVRDEFGRAFRASLAGRPAGEARIEGDDPNARLPLYPTFVWDISELGPGEAARAEVTAVTTRDRDGNMQFSRPGIYSIDTGARLTYTLAGKTQVRNAGCGSVIARKDMGALRSEGPPFDIDAGPIAGDGTGTGAGSVVPVLPPIVGDGPNVRAVITRAGHHVGTRSISTGAPSFTIVAAGKPGYNINEIADAFQVPTGEHLEWDVTATVENSTASDWSGWVLYMVFGPKLSAEVTEVSVDPADAAYPGTPTLESDPVSGIVRVRLPNDPANKTFKKGGKLIVKLRVYTTGTSGYDTAGTYPFLVGADNQGSLPWLYEFAYWVPPESGGGDGVLSGNGIDVTAGPAAVITVSSTRQDWRVRKPGTYAALATEMSFTGVGTLSVQFGDGTDRDFADLQGPGGGSPIETWYGFGEDLAAVETAGWTTAGALNSTTKTVTLGSGTRKLLMWSKINVGEEDSSCEYDDQGVITFTVSNQ
ncbi:MAG: hypothetical protein AB1700_06650 [Bacillota bacterium]